jgi:hypothetical protein
MAPRDSAPPIAPSRPSTPVATALLLLLLATFLPSQIAAQAALTISSDLDLAFGAVVPGPSSGTVTVTPEGTRSSSGGVTLGGSAGVSPSTFTVSGEPALTFSIVLTSSTTLSDGASTMTVDSFTSSPESTGTLDASGDREIRVGATLHLAATQASGSYAGGFSVMVAYN